MSGKRKVKGWKAISNPIITPYDYSNDGREEQERQERDERNYEVIGNDGRMKLNQRIVLDILMPSNFLS